MLRSSKNIVTNTRASGEYDLEQYAKECRTISACAYRSDLNLVWLSVLSASKSLKMDLIEGRVRYRKGKKVSCKSWIMLGAFQYSFIFCLLQWKIRWAVLRRVNPATGKLCTFLTQIIYTMIFVANTDFSNWVL